VEQQQQEHTLCQPEQEQSKQQEQQQRVSLRPIAFLAERLPESWIFICSGRANESGCWSFLPLMGEKEPAGFAPAGGGIY